MAMAESDPEMQYMSGSSGGQHDVALRHQPHILKERTPFKKNHFVPPGTANRDTAISYKRLLCRGKSNKNYIRFYISLGLAARYRGRSFKRSKKNLCRSTLCFTFKKGPSMGAYLNDVYIGREEERGILYTGTGL